MKTYTYTEILDIICAAQREAAQLIMQASHIIGERKSSARDVVTEYDRRVQELLVQRLKEGVEGARFFCEENELQDDLNAEHVFIIDPIDGTMNFVQQLNHSCISVGYMSRGLLRVGAVYNPYVDEMFTAVLGQGAKLNGKPIHAADTSLAESLVVCGTSPYNPELMEKSFNLIKEVYHISLDIRRQGASALDFCSVAAGRAGLYFELAISFWDYAAGLIILLEAGGTALDCEGRPLPLDGRKTSVAVGSKKAVEEFLCIAGRL